MDALNRPSEQKLISDTDIDISFYALNVMARDFLSSNHPLEYECGPATMQSSL